MTRSVEEIRSESERERAQLARTVHALRNRITETTDEIRYRASPAGIKDEVTGYIAGHSKHWGDTLKQQAMEHPMQAAATAVAVAVPAVKFLRSVPLPFLMIGAGLALTSTRVRNAVLSLPPIEEGSVRANEVATSIKDTLHSTQSSVQRAASDTRDTLAAKAEDVRDAVVDTVTAVRSSVNERLQSGIETATVGTKEMFDAARQNLTDFASNSRNSAQGFVQANAVIVGGLGVAMGAIIAAALPATRAESKSLGRASGKVQRMTVDAVESEFDRAKDAVMSVVDDVGQKIADSSDTNRAAGNMADKLKTVTDEAVTTAFDHNHQHE